MVISNEFLADIGGGVLRMNSEKEQKALCGITSQ